MPFGRALGEWLSLSPFIFSLSLSLLISLFLSVSTLLHGSSSTTRRWRWSVARSERHARSYRPNIVSTVVSHFVRGAQILEFSSMEAVCIEGWGVWFGVSGYHWALRLVVAGPLPSTRSKYGTTRYCMGESSRFGGNIQNWWFNPELAAELPLRRREYRGRHVPKTLNPSGF